MRDLQLPGRSPVHGTNGMAATSHPASTLTALDVLRDGGNAIDAAIAACAVQCVVEPHSTAIGGDCFVLYVPGGKGDVIALNGSGKAPAAATVEWYLEQGIAEIGKQSAHAVTVPAAIAAWQTLADDHGTKGLDELLQPAIGYAEDGYVIHSVVSAVWHREQPKLEADPNAARIFLPEGRPMRVGEIHRQPELGRTLRTIAAEGRDGFYKGAIAADMVDYLRGIGGLHTLDDFAAAGADYVTPIRTDYRGHTVYECPPNGQGIIALMMLNMLSDFDLSALEPMGATRLHLEAEATRLAYRDRDVYVADPSQADVPIEKLLSGDYAAAMHELISPERRLGDLPPAGEPRGPDHRDTVYLSIVDKDNNAVSFINSIFHSFGSGLVSPKSGVLFSNRGTGFRIDPDHLSCIAPGKRPMHTIIPGMLMQDDRAVMPFGVMGGHYQPVGHVHFLTNFLDFGMDVQESLDAARCFAFQDELQVERGVRPDVARDLASLGHPVVTPPVPLGGGQAVHIDWQRGVLTGGSDPRKDGLALGY